MPRGRRSMTPRASSARKANGTAQGLLAKARQLATAVPITEKEASDPTIAGAFRELKQGEKVAGRQAEFESRWDSLRARTTPRRARLPNRH